MSAQYSDNSNPNTSVIYTALSSLTPSLLGKRLVLSADYGTVDPTRLLTMTATAPSAGTNGIWTSASEVTPIVGATYKFEITNAMPGRFCVYPFVAIASTTSFTDLADQFVAQARVFISQSSPIPLPATVVNTGGHLVITEVPPTGYTTGEARLNVGFIYNSANAAQNTYTTTLNVAPVGQYATLQRAYLLSTGTSVGSMSGTYAGTGWIGNGPVSGKSYTVLTMSGSPIDKPNNDVYPYYTNTIYLSSDLSAAELAYAKGVIGNYSGIAGVSGGAEVVMVPTVTSPSGVGVIPVGITEASVTSANAGYFIGLPASGGTAGHPIGKPIYLTGNGTSYLLKAPTGVAINSGSTGGSGLVPASCTITCLPVSASNWVCTAQLNSGTGVATAMPASS